MKGRSIARLFVCCLLVVCFGLLSACSTTAPTRKIDLAKLPEIPKKIAQKVSDPILGFAVDDARSTLEWIGKAEHLSAEDKREAARCPEAVLRLDDLRRELLEVGDEPTGRKAAIYYSTVRKYSEDPRDRVKNAAQEVVGACAPLVLEDSDVAARLFIR